MSQSAIRFQRLTSLLDNLDAWNSNQTEKQEAGIRSGAAFEILTAVFSSNVPIRYGRDVKQNAIDARTFETAEYVSVKRCDTDSGDAYEVNITASAPRDNLTVRKDRRDNLILETNENNNLILNFEGYITEQDGVVAKRPAIIRYSQSEPIR